MGDPSLQNKMPILISQTPNGGNGAASNAHVQSLLDKAYQQGKAESQDFYQSRLAELERTIVDLSERTEAESIARESISLRSHFDQKFDLALTNIEESVTLILRPIIEEILVSKSILHLRSVLNTYLESQIHREINVLGPTRLVERLKTELTESNWTVVQETIEDNLEDLAVHCGRTQFTTRLAHWENELREHLEILK